MYHQRLLYLFLCFAICFACEKESLSTNERVLEVEIVDFDNSCDWNLKIIGDEVVSNFSDEYTYQYLYSDIDLYEEYEIGDTIKIEFEVLEECPYPKRLILCNVHHGVPIRILRIVE